MSTDSYRNAYVSSTDMAGSNAAPGGTPQNGYPWQANGNVETNHQIPPWQLQGSASASESWTQPVAEAPNYAYPSAGNNVPHQQIASRGAAQHSTQHTEQPAQYYAEQQVPQGGAWQGNFSNAYGTPEGNPSGQQNSVPQQISEAPVSASLNDSASQGDYMRAPWQQSVQPPQGSLESTTGAETTWRPSSAPNVAPWNQSAPAANSNFPLQQQAGPQEYLPPNPQQQYAPQYQNPAQQHQVPSQQLPPQQMSPPPAPGQFQAPFYPPGPKEDSMWQPQSALEREQMQSNLQSQGGFSQPLSVPPPATEVGQLPPPPQWAPQQGSHWPNFPSHEGASLASMTGGDEDGGAKKRRSRWGPQGDEQAGDVANSATEAKGGASSGGNEMGEESAGGKKRRSRWGDEGGKSEVGAKPQPSAFKGVDLTDPAAILASVKLPDFMRDLAGAAVVDPEVRALNLKLVEINRKLQSGNLVEGAADNRSPSPEPFFDENGRQVNTREARARERLSYERQVVISELIKKDPKYKPPSDYRPPKLSKKIYIPLKEASQHNFVGLIIGPRGNTQKRMERESGARILIRGKGSTKEGKANIPGKPKYDPHEHEDLHVYIEAETAKSLEAAAEMIEKLLEPGGIQEHKRAQLRELAELNGTRPEEEYGCHVCGEEGHRHYECPKKRDGGQLGFHPEGQGDGYPARDGRMRPFGEGDPQREAGYRAMPVEVSMGRGTSNPGMPPGSGRGPGGMGRGPGVGPPVSGGPPPGGFTSGGPPGPAGGFSGPPPGSVPRRPSGRLPNGDGELNLYVGYLPVSVDDAQLVRLFAPFGRVEDAEVVLDAGTGFSRGFGYVKFSDATAGRKAMDAMQGFPLQGSQLSVRYASQMPTVGVPGGPPGGGLTGVGRGLGPAQGFAAGPLGPGMGPGGGQQIGGGQSGGYRGPMQSSGPDNSFPSNNAFPPSQGPSQASHPGAGQFTQGLPPGTTAPMSGPGGAVRQYAPLQGSYPPTSNAPPGGVGANGMPPRGVAPTVQGSSSQYPQLVGLGGPRPPMAGMSYPRPEGAFPAQHYPPQHGPPAQQGQPPQQSPPAQQGPHGSLPPHQPQQMQYPQQRPPYQQPPPYQQGPLTGYPSSFPPAQRPGPPGPSNGPSNPPWLAPQQQQQAAAGGVAPPPWAAAQQQPQRPPHAGGAFPPQQSVLSEYERFMADVER
eukprot:TRINITY_DN8754_c0_g2_i1.p1 TRINITY_DN8754_c0_g2~~TRINITY_DN8754_c0_g2_i1.p1  ORF type:complete len:1187 (+),score=220.75 TRINITY_DN8754_c0_g2_i1:132-3692(+)